MKNHPDHFLLIEQEKQSIGGKWRIALRMTRHNGLGRCYSVQAKDFETAAAARPDFDRLKAGVQNAADGYVCILRTRGRAATPRP